MLLLRAVPKLPSPAAASSVVLSRLLLMSWALALGNERIHESHGVTQNPAMQLDKADTKRRENSLTAVHPGGNEQSDFNNPVSHKPPMEEHGLAVPLSQSGRQGLRLSYTDTAPPQFWAPGLGSSVWEG